MESRAKVLGHPLHQMMIVLPLGLLAGASLFDVAYLITKDAHYATTSRSMILLGFVTGLLAAVPGLIDWVAIPTGTRAKWIGAVHGFGNVVVLLIYGISWLLRREAPSSPAALPLVLGFVGFALAGVTGWLGGELVDRLGVGVDDGAHLNSPNSLSRRPASDSAERANSPHTPNTL